VFYAQVRFRESREWVTFAKAESRRSASEYAMAAFRDARDELGRSPVRARVLTPRHAAGPTEADR
jgi:hypothetical protein